MQPLTRNDRLLNADRRTRASPTESARNHYGPSAAEPGRLTISLGSGPVKVFTDDAVPPRQGLPIVSPRMASATTPDDQVGPSYPSDGSGSRW